MIDNILPDNCADGLFETFILINNTVYNDFSN